VEIHGSLVGRKDLTGEISPAAPAHDHSASSAYEDQT
jgi:hypothetical protein